MEAATHTLAEATRSAPYIDYAVCLDADNRPMNHQGDWPMKGRIYAVRVVESRPEGIPHRRRTSMPLLRTASKSSSGCD